MTNQQIQQMHALKQQGKGYNAIARELNIPVGTVNSYFVRLAKKKELSLCKNCGAKMQQSKGHRQKTFCSDSCRYAWWGKHPEERTLKTFTTCTCKECGKEFRVYGGKGRLFCSRECYLKFHAKGVEEK